MNPKSAARLLVYLLVLSPVSLAAVEAPAIPAAPGSNLTAPRCGRLLDPAGGRTTENAVVLVREGRIFVMKGGQVYKSPAR